MFRRFAEKITGTPVEKLIKKHEADIEKDIAKIKNNYASLQSLSTTQAAKITAMQNISALLLDIYKYKFSIIYLTQKIGDKDFNDKLDIKAYVIPDGAYTTPLTTIKAFLNSASFQEALLDLDFDFNDYLDKLRQAKDSIDVVNIIKKLKFRIEAVEAETTAVNHEADELEKQQEGSPVKIEAVSTSAESTKLEATEINPAPFLQLGTSHPKLQPGYQAIPSVSNPPHRPIPPRQHSLIAEALAKPLQPPSSEGSESKTDYVEVTPPKPSASVEKAEESPKPNTESPYDQMPSKEELKQQNKEVQEHPGAVLRRADTQEIIQIMKEGGYDNLPQQQTDLATKSVASPRVEDKKEITVSTEGIPKPTTSKKQTIDESKYPNLPNIVNAIYGARKPLYLSTLADSEVEYKKALYARFSELLAHQTERKNPLTTLNDINEAITRKGIGSAYSALLKELALQEGSVTTEYRDKIVDFVVNNNLYDQVGGHIPTLNYLAQSWEKFIKSPQVKKDSATSSPTVTTSTSPTSVQPTDTTPNKTDYVVIPPSPVAPSTATTSTQASDEKKEATNPPATSSVNLVNPPPSSEVKQPSSTTSSATTSTVSTPASTTSSPASSTIPSTPSSTSSTTASTVSTPASTTSSPASSTIPSTSSSTSSTTASTVSTPASTTSSPASSTIPSTSSSTSSATTSTVSTPASQTTSSSVVSSSTMSQTSAARFFRPARATTTAKELVYANQVKTVEPKYSYDLTAYEAANNTLKYSYGLQGAPLKDTAVRLISLAEVVHRAIVNNVFATSIDITGTTQEVQDTVNLMYAIDPNIFNGKAINISVTHVDGRKSSVENGDNTTWAIVELQPPSSNDIYRQAMEQTKPGTHNYKEEAAVASQGLTQRSSP